MHPVIARTVLAILLLPLPALCQIPVVGEVAIERLYNSDGTEFAPASGFTFATDGVTAVIGIPRDSTLAEDAGTALVFARRSNGTWLQTHTLVPSNAGPCGRFGWSVAVAGDIILVEQTSNLRFITPPGQSPCGGDPLDRNQQVHVFERTGSGWIETTTVPRGCCGSQLAIDGDTVAVTRGSLGVEALQRLAPGVWSTPDFLPEVGSAGVLDSEDPGFIPVDISNDTIVIGSTVNAFSTGSYVQDSINHDAFVASANVYVRDTQGQWQLQANLVTERLIGTSGLRRPGAPVSLQGNALALGTFMFTRNRYGDWTRTADLTPPGVIQSVAGVKLAAEDIAFTGSPTDVFRRDALGNWHPVARLRSTTAVTASGIAVKSRLYSLVPPNAIHVFEAPAPGCAPRMAQMRVDPDAAVAGDPIEVSVFADATGSDFSTIRTLEYSVAGGPWTQMTPRDGAYDEIFEAGVASATAGIAGTTAPGNYPVCFRMTDVDGHMAELPNILSQSCQSIEILPPPSSTDRWAPVVSELRLYASQVTVGQDNAVVAFADDTGRGESGIRSLQWSIDVGPWHVMMPIDTRYEDLRFGAELYESATASLPPLPAGTHFVCVRAVDRAGNVSDGQSCERVDVVSP